MDPTGEIENYLRTADPCNPVEDCYDQFLDPCVCAPDGVSCVVVEENDIVGININLPAYAEIINELESNPYFLVELDCNQIQNWQTLGQHTAPQSIIDKVNNLPSNLFNEFYIQTLDDAGGTIVNLDYFSVNVSTLPINPNNGLQFTPDEFQDYFRRNINDFVDGSTFEPYCEISSICQQETDLWNSNDPIGSLIY